MKKIMRFVLIAAIMVMAFGTYTARANNEDVTIEAASGRSSQVTVSGSTAAIAVLVQLRNSAGSVVAMRTGGTVDGKFTVVIDNLSLSAGTYTVYAADYEGGSWATAEVKISGSSHHGGDEGGGSTGETTEEQKPAEEKTEEKAEEKQSETTVKENADGSTVETVKETKTNDSGNEVQLTTKTTTDPEGNVEKIVEVAKIPEADKNTSVTITITKDGEGEVQDSVAEVKSAANDGKATLTADVAKQIKDIGGEDCTIILTVKDEEGKKLGTVSVDAEDIVPGQKLYMYQVLKDGEIVMVEDNSCTVSKNGKLTKEITAKGNYQLVTREEAKELNKQILATVKPANKKLTLKVDGKKKFAFSDKFNKKNAVKITYSTSDKKVAKINKKGVITGKKSGDVKVTAKVTLKNGKTKTVTTKITIKAGKKK